MRPLLTFVLFVALLAGARAADVEFVRVWDQWRDAESFRRISEYFDGKENPGSQVILRTHPDVRDGFYFLTRVKNNGAATSAAKIVLTLITPDSPKAKVHTFPIELPAGETVYNLGLTGDDWAGKKIHPVAWKIEVETADGRVLGVYKSFLWEKPDTK